jgi:RNA polymerase primary sigma factor
VALDTTPTPQGREPATMMTHQTPRLDTPRNSPSGLDAYLAEIRGDELLTAAEERALAEAIARGDRGARDRMVRANLRLVVKIARDFEGKGLTLDDLVGEGNLGLLRAAVEYDPAFGTRFSTYAAHWIKQAIRHALTNTAATIRLPSHMVGLLSKWRKAERRLRRDLGREPTAREIGDELGLSPAQRDMVDRAFQARRLRQEGGEADDAWAPEDAPDYRDDAPDARLIADDQRRDLEDRLARLDDRERLVVSLRFGLSGDDPLTLKEVGKRLGVTREWVRKIELRAVQKLEDGTAATRRERRLQTA